MQLWDVQEQMIVAVRASFRAGHRRPLLVSPTGSGKTVMFSYMTHNHTAKGGRVMLLVHRQELIDQVSATLSTFNVPHGYMAARIDPDTSKPALVCSVQSVLRRMPSLPWRPTLIIVDEAHHATHHTAWGKVLAFYGCHSLGVTATPVRLSGEGLGDVFDDMVLGPSTQELIDRGYLCRFRVFCPSAPDLSGVHKNHGDYSTAELQEAVDRPSLTGDAVAHYRLHADNRQAVPYCVSVEHAHHVAESFRKAGYQAASIDGSMPEHHRRQMVRDFRDRHLKIMTSCDLISEGFDVPGIEVCISLRPTHSLGLWLQQTGRGLRTAPGKKELIIMDHAGNAIRHGLPSEKREWSLAGTKSTATDKERVQSVRVCPKCWAAMSSKEMRCVQCGTPFEAQPREVPQKKGQLEEMTAEMIEARRFKESEEDKRSLAFLTELGRKRGYKNPEGWAAHVVAGIRAKKTLKRKAL